MLLGCGICAIVDSVVICSVTIDIETTSQQVAIRIGDLPGKGGDRFCEEGIGCRIKLIDDRRIRDGQVETGGDGRIHAIGHAQDGGIQSRCVEDMITGCVVGAVVDGVVGCAITIGIEFAGQCFAIGVAHGPAKGGGCAGGHGGGAAAKAADDRCRVAIDHNRNRHRTLPGRVYRIGEDQTGRVIARGCVGMRLGKRVATVGDGVVRRAVVVHVELAGQGVAFRIRCGPGKGDGGAGIDTGRVDRERTERRLAVDTDIDLRRILCAIAVSGGERDDVVSHTERGRDVFAGTECAIPARGPAQAGAAQGTVFGIGCAALQQDIAAFGIDGATGRGVDGGLRGLVGRGDGPRVTTSTATGGQQGKGQDDEDVQARCGAHDSPSQGIRLPGHLWHRFRAAD